MNKLETNFHQFQCNYNSVTWLVQTPKRYANFRMVGVLVLSKFPAKKKKRQGHRFMDAKAKIQVCVEVEGRLIHNVLSTFKDT